jgi:molybdopterin synthase catalytic subunit
MIEILAGPLDIIRYQLLLDDRACGAVCVFEGRVRTHNEGREVAELSYECYEPMARRQMEALRRLAIGRFGLGKALMAHRIGDVPIGEAAVWIGVASAHREAAFAACRFLIDEVKLKVPIWKKERYLSGNCAWVGCGHEHAAAPL